MSASPGGRVTVVVLDMILDSVVEGRRENERKRAEPSTSGLSVVRGKMALNMSGSEIAGRIIRRRSPSVILVDTRLHRTTTIATTKGWTRTATRQ